MTPPIYSEYRSANGISEMNLLAREGFIYVDTIPGAYIHTTVAFLMVRTVRADDAEE